MNSSSSARSPSSTSASAWARARWILAAAALALTPACKQGLGERCQTSADCDDGLICSQAEPKTCGGLDQEQIDGVYIPVDAPFDAPVDAPVDVPPG